MVKDKNKNLITDSEEVLSPWKNYFERLLNVEFRNDQKRTENLESHTIEPTIEEPTISEVKDAVKRLKNHKAASIDSIPAELIKWGDSRLMKYLN